MKFKVTMIKSPLGYNYKTRLVAKSLGLSKINQSIEVSADNSAHMGMVNKIRHILAVEKV